MPRFTVFRANRSDLDRLRGAVAHAHRLAESDGVGLTYFVPAIGHLGSSDLAAALPGDMLQRLLKRTLVLGNGHPVRLVSAITSRFERGVILALWTAPERMVELEGCTHVRDVVVLTNDIDELDEWIAANESAMA
ncbi:hypothetical protein [Luteibacter aegosomatissinici]|uniref:hypothetical protein n=1 Tax=Luteibacter aegosomatissinici TaxID=2911539 RepID=UPI001FF9E8A8|nr:hypothetical protein [Luteibacter aegosomatissinici]UPG92706.1 hypothetical protein L2Y97_12605 [Luteibacter aegosomatissinici]